MKFPQFSAAVAKHFAQMVKTGLYVVEVDKGAQWDLYLKSFPEGTNPLYVKNRDHDCNCCRHFMRAMGGLVTIVDNKVVSLWDVPGDLAHYSIVTKALSEQIHENASIVGVEGIYRTQYKSYGADKEKKIIEGVQHVFNHFFLNMPDEVVVDKDSIGKICGQAKTAHQMFFAALTKITQDSIDTVLELIAQNSLLSGAEFLHMVEGLNKAKKVFSKLKTDVERNLFVWTQMTKLSGAITGIKNASIGGLLENLSEGMELDVAVGKYEKMVGGDNYKRPTALVTKNMIAQAQKKISDMGFLSALERRYATIEDITINDLLWSNQETKSHLAPNIFETLGASIPEKKKSLGKVEEMSFEDFMEKVAKSANSIELLFENDHIPSLVSLIAPVDPTARNMFSHGNNFSWDYYGNYARSVIRSQVASRGGNVTGAFRFSHSWNYDKRNTSLMDLHVFMPGNTMKPDNPTNELYGTGRRIGWNCRSDTKSGGVQDVDYVAEAPVGYVPVENISFPDLKKMPEGTYICKVHNWRHRVPTEGGFRAEIECGGQVYEYEHPRALKNHEWVTVAEVELKNGVFTLKHHLPCQSAQKTVWNLPTQVYHKVNAIMLSPNYWGDSAVGNKQAFFMLDNCLNDSTARGFYNEILCRELNEHRKVLEVVGNKLRTENADRQLSGVGFSLSARNSVTVRVTGAFTRNVKIQF